MSRPPLSSVLPPLILGTGTFNYQYHPDPTRMPYVDIVRRALQHDIVGFDTSPYYGPSEILLGEALDYLTPPPPREGYFLVTKAGRIASDEFDYSPAWIRYSICRSLERLRTTYLDLVYMHDVEFVSPREVLDAVRELRRLRDQGFIRYVGISGYPVDVLASLAGMILEETGEPLDAVLSYSHFCVQNDTLGHDDLLSRFQAAGIECLLNGSMLSMGLITTIGADNAPMAAWHPAPSALRKACHDLSGIAEKHGERLEKVALRWALQNWAQRGAPLGTRRGLPQPAESATARDGGRVGVSVMGVAAVDELEETWRLWTDVVMNAGQSEQRARKEKVDKIVREEMWPSLGEWKDYSWVSGGEGFVNQRKKKDKGSIPLGDGVAEKWGLTWGKKDQARM